MAVAILGRVPVPPAPGAFHKTDQAPQFLEAAGASLFPATTFVPGGRFAIGAAWVDGRPVREAEVRPLRVGLTPVSNASYAQFLAASGTEEPPWWRDPDFCDPEQPVVGVTWFEAVAYCDWLHDTIGGRWRLPTEAEWEHAAALLDIGNAVHEWCRDWFTPDALQLARRYDPRGPESGDRRVRRGASWRSRACAASWRDGLDPSDRAADGGFRAVREVP
jgi:formylglycine-generating enzyme required for sulfatase activity